MPLDSRADVRCASADVTMTAASDPRRSTRASGDLRVDDDRRRPAAPLGQRRLGVSDVGGDRQDRLGLRRRTDRGGSVATCAVRSASGDVDRRGGRRRRRSTLPPATSGSVRCTAAPRRSTAPRATCRSASPRAPRSGSTSTRCPATPAANWPCPTGPSPTADVLRLQVHTLSGDVLIRRAAPVASTRAGRSTDGEVSELPLAAMPATVSCSAALSSTNAVEAFDRRPGGVRAWIGKPGTESDVQPGERRPRQVAQPP